MSRPEMKKSLSPREWLLRWMYPNRCPLCRRPIPTGALLCGSCESLWDGPRWRLLNVEVLGGRPMLCCAAAPYEGEVRRSIYRFKFRGKTSYAEGFARLMARAAEFDQPFDCIAYVPMYGKKQRERGYNQSELLARHLSKLLDVPLEPLLEKQKDNTAQHTLTRTQRRLNVRGVYRVCCGPERLEGKTVLLVDDILTTGATLCECARMLYRAGAKSVCGLCIADRQ